MTIKSLLSVYAEVVTQLTTKNIEVSSAESLMSDLSSCGKSLKQTRQNRWPSTEPCKSPCKVNLRAIEI